MTVTISPPDVDGVAEMTIEGSLTWAERGALCEAVQAALPAALESPSLIAIDGGYAWEEGEAKRVLEWLLDRVTRELSPAPGRAVHLISGSTRLTGSLIQWRWVIGRSV